MAATTWDPNYKSANITLSGGNLVATGNASVGDCIATRAVSGLTYCEFIIGATLTSSLCVGLASHIMPFTTLLGTDTTGSFPGAQSVAYEHGGTVKINNVTVLTIQTFAAGNTVCMAYNPLTQLIWFRVGAGNWNNAAIGSQNPVGSVGGISTATLNSTVIYPAMGSNANNQAVTGVFSTASFAQTPPTGYITVDTIQVASLGFNGDVASHSASFTQYGAAKKVTASSPHQVASTMAARNATITNAWYGYNPLWSPAAATTYGAGTVAEGSTLVGGKLVRLYDNKTGILLGSISSTAVTGAFSIPALGRAKIFAVAFDPTTFEMLGYDNVAPV